MRAIIGCTRNSRNEPAKIVATNRTRVGAESSPPRSTAVAIRSLTLAQASAGIWPRETDFGLRPFDHVSDVPAERVIGRKAWMGEIEVGSPHHPESLHKT